MPSLYNCGIMAGQTQDTPVDCSPLSLACIKALGDREEGKRRFAANEIEKMTLEFSLANNLTMINRLVIVLGRKFCLSSETSKRKGGLLGLAAVMVGFKNGSIATPPSETVEEAVRPILTCFQDPDPLVRASACESLINVTKVADSNILPLFESIFDNLAKIVADPDILVRSGAEQLNRLLKDIIVKPDSGYDVQNFVPKLEEYIYTRNPRTKMFILNWIRLLDSKNDMIPHLTCLLDGVFNCLYDSTDEIRASTLSLLSEFFSGDSPSTQQSTSNINRFVRALYNMFHDKDVVFEERGTFIIMNLCSLVKPETVYNAFAEIIKDERSDLKFAYKMVQKLNQILFTTQPLFGLRSRLGNDDSPEMITLFHSLYYAWCHSPIAALTLCLLTKNYRHASEIVTALSQNDITVDILTQIDWTIQLIESPVFATLRMRLLDINNNQYLLQSLYGLLMILPQSEAFRKLGCRLDQVYRFMSIQPQSSKTVIQSSQVTHKPTQTGSKDLKKTSSSTNLETLMRHYFTIQNLTRETRRP